MIARSLCLLAVAATASLAAQPERVGETPHFWYRMPAEDAPYVDSQRDALAFAFKGQQIMLSEDCGKTWPHVAEFAEAQNITFSVILGNGNVLFATRERLFLSADKLKSHREIVVVGLDGEPYLPHKPTDPALPGWYYHSLDGDHCFDLDGKEMLVWGNYCNVSGGSVPVNLYYSVDGGQTVKVAYSFGQNPHFQQKGAEGPLLGNADNPVIARHVHQVTYSPTEKAFYACTGDIDRGHGDEVHWLRGSYDAAKDHWQWTVLISVNSNSRFKCGGINFVDGRLYWIADANGPKFGPLHDRGVFVCDPADVLDKKKHTLLFNPGYESANMLMQDGVMLATHCAPASPYLCGIIYSPDQGKTWAQYDLKEFGPRSGVRIQKKNSEGWFRMDLRTGWIDRAEVLFLKPKP
jgi:hypothetical protein